MVQCHFHLLTAACRLLCPFALLEAATLQLHKASWNVSEWSHPGGLDLLLLIHAGNTKTIYSLRHFRTYCIIVHVHIYIFYIYALYANCIWLLSTCDCTIKTNLNLIEQTMSMCWQMSRYKHWNYEWQAHLNMHVQQHVAQVKWIEQKPNWKSVVVGQGQSESSRMHSVCALTSQCVQNKPWRGASMGRPSTLWAPFKSQHGCNWSGHKKTGKD